MLGGISERIAEQLRALRDGAPGGRFQELHRVGRERGGRGWKRLCEVGGGSLLFWGGLLTYPVPGPPSTLMVLVGLALVAQGSLRVAQLLDRLEVSLRSRQRSGSEMWRRLPVGFKMVIGLLGLAFLAALAYGSYRVTALI